jgi:hypothetical protein
VLVRIPPRRLGARRTRILRVVVLLSAFAFSFFSPGQTRDAVPSAAVNTAGERLALKEKSSVFSIDLSANVPKSISATFEARILAPDDFVTPAPRFSPHFRFSSSAFLFSSFGSNSGFTRTNYSSAPISRAIRVARAIRDSPAGFPEPHTAIHSRTPQLS